MFSRPIQRYACRYIRCLVPSITLSFHANCSKSRMVGSRFAPQVWTSWVFLFSSLRHLRCLYSGTIWDTLYALHLLSFFFCFLPKTAKCKQSNSFVYLLMKVLRDLPGTCDIREAWARQNLQLQEKQLVSIEHLSVYLLLLLVAVFVIVAFFFFFFLFVLYHHCLISITSPVVILILSLFFFFFLYC